MRKGFTFIELIIICIIMFIVASVIRSCGIHKETSPNKFVGLQSQALAETTTAPNPIVSEPEPTPEQPKTHTYTLVNGSTVECAQATETNCGVRLTECSNKRNYYCLSNLSVAEEDDN